MSIDQSRMAAFIDENRKAVIEDFARPDTRCSALSRWANWIFDRVAVPDPVPPPPEPMPMPAPPRPPVPIPVVVFDDDEADMFAGDETGEWGEQEVVHEG